MFSSSPGQSINAEIRIRGETSRTYPKKSFKVNFASTSRFEGRDKINLVSEYTDPSFIREYLSYDLFRRAGLLAPNVSFVRLYVNNRYYGLFSDIEQVDECFLRHRGLDKDTPIFKAAENNTLMIAGEIEIGLWERENENDSTFDELENLIEWVADVPESRFYDELQDRFNARHLARAIAINALIGNTSTYYHNYFLVRFIGENGRWAYVPWDVDKTFSYGGNYSDPPFSRSGHQYSGANNLIKRCWLDTRMKSLIASELRNVQTTLFQPEYYQELTDTLSDLLFRAAEEDTAKQYSMNDFRFAMDRIPSDVRGRGVKLLELVEATQPFEVFPAIVTPDGVLFRWTSASRSDTDNVTYQLQVSADYHISPPEWGASNLTDSSVVLTNLPQGTFFWRVLAQDDLRRWQVSLSQSSTFTIGEFDFNAIEPPYLINSSSVIRPAQGTYTALRDVVVESDGVLQIEEGVRILFADTAKLIVRGRIETVDSPGDSVRLVPLDPEKGWGGIILENGSHAELTRLSIKGGTSQVEEDALSGSIMVGRNVWLTLKKSTIEAGESAGIVRQYGRAGALEIDSCKFVGSDDAIFWHQGEVVIIKNSAFIGDGGNLPGDSGELNLGLVSLAEIEKSVIISNCTFRSAAVGLSLNYCNSSIINRCLFNDITAIGLVRWDVGYCDISNNIFINCETGINSYDGGSEVWNSNFIECGYVTTSEPDNLSFTNSLFFHNDHYSSDNNSFRANYCLADDMLPGVGNIPGHPLLENFRDNNFTPQVGSALIDAGMSDGAPTTDYLGNRRVNVDHHKNLGTGRYKYYDIGAVEYPFGEVTPPAMNGSTMYIYPNPSNNRATLVYEVEIAGDVTIGLYDLMGREIGTNTFRSQVIGQYELGLESLIGERQLSTGIYIFRLAQPLGTTHSRLIVLR